MKTHTAHEWYRVSGSYELKGSRYWLKKRRGKTFVIMHGLVPYGNKCADLESGKRIIEALEGMENDHD